MLVCSFVTITFSWTEINTAEGYKAILTEFSKRFFFFFFMRLVLLEIARRVLLEVRIAEER